MRVVAIGAIRFPLSQFSLRIALVRVSQHFTILGFCPTMAVEAKGINLILIYIGAINIGE